MIGYCGGSIEKFYHSTSTIRVPYTGSLPSNAKLGKKKIRKNGTRRCRLQQIRISRWRFHWWYPLSPKRGMFCDDKKGHCFCANRGHFAAFSDNFDVLLWTKSKIGSCKYLFFLNNYILTWHNIINVYSIEQFRYVIIC